MESEPLTFDAPPADIVLMILTEKARNDGRLAAQIEAAQWQAIAIATKTDQEPDQ